MRAATKTPDALQKLQSAMRWDEFESYVDAGLWTKLVVDSGSSVAAGDYDGGQILITTGGTDNNEAGIFTTNKLFLFADRRAILYELLIQYAEADTNKANIWAGIHSAALANILVDDGAGPATSFSGFGIYKVDGETVWRAVSSLGTTQTISKSTKTAGGSSFVKLGMLFSAVGDPAKNQGEVSFFVDDLPLYDSAIRNMNVAIKHQLDYTSAAAMKASVYAKAGSGTSQTMLVDGAGWSQTRINWPGAAA